MTTSQAQNTPERIRLLAAQRHLYGQAKIARRARSFGTLLLVSLVPTIAYLQPDVRAPLVVLAAVWLVAARVWLASVEVDRIQLAATIQEQFDVEVFRLPWNSVLVGDRPTLELIEAADRAFAGSRQELRDWYPDTSCVPHPVGVLLCQRSNLVWDWRLHQQWAAGTAALTLLLFAAITAPAILLGVTVSDYLLVILVPSLSAFLEGSDITRAHLRIADNERSAERHLARLWEAWVTGKAPLGLSDNRQIQDVVYTLRSNGPLVPDCLYRRLRAPYEADMKRAITKLRDQATGADLTAPLPLSPTS